MSKSYKECAAENAARKQERKYPSSEVVAEEATDEALAEAEIASGGGITAEGE